MKKRKLGKGVVIVGAGMSKFGMFKQRDSKDLFAETFVEALSAVDKRFGPSEIEPLYLGNYANEYFASLEFLER